MILLSEIYFKNIYCNCRIRVRYLLSPSVRNPRIERSNMASSTAPRTQFIRRTQARDNTSYKKLWGRKQPEQNQSAITNETKSCLPLVCTLLHFIFLTSSVYSDFHFASIMQLTSLTPKKIPKHF